MLFLWKGGMHNDEALLRGRVEFSQQALLMLIRLGIL